MTVDGVSVRRMRLRYAGTCACGVAVPAGTRAGYDREAKRAVCPGCLPARLVRAEPSTRETLGQAAVPPSRPSAPEPYAVTIQPVASGTAGASAAAEYARRAAKREERIRKAHPRLGALILAVSDDPQSTRAWASGAVGERAIGAKLDALAGDGVLTLHDRRVPGTRANIDHIAIGPSGVFVLDAKRYNDAKVEIRTSGGWFSERVERLYVGGRDKTKLVTAVAGQVAAVMEALEDLPDLPGVLVTPVLAFVDALLPIMGTLEIAGVPVVGPRKAAKLVRREGALDAPHRARLHAHLAAKLPTYEC